MMLHITPESNGYFENMWAWVADHDIDDAANTMVTVAAARGILIESASGPTWFYGTASEHSMLYQYNFYNTSNMFAGMIQTESPYFQYTTGTQSPGPFNSSIGLFSNDPIFPDGTCNGTDLLCSFSWAVMVQEVDNLTIAGAGLYSWFDAYDQSVCVDGQNCQQRLFNDGGGNGAFWLWNLVTIGAVEMISDTYTGASIYASNNTQAIAHPFWSALGAYMDDYLPLDQTCPDDDISAACIVETVCDNTKTFTTLDALQAAAGTFPNICTDYYALGVLSSTLNQGLANYSSVNSGYDSLFDDYVQYTKEMIPQALQDFMAYPSLTRPDGGPGNKYFDCTFDDGDSPVTQRCPFDSRYLALYDTYTLTYTLINSTGFYNDLSTNYGINASWVTFGNTGTYIANCVNPKTCVRTDIKIVNIPKASDSITVPNSKDIITKALPNIGALQNTILSREMDVATHSWFGPTDDLLQVISMPVFMIQQALVSMANVKAVGEKERKQKKIALILEIIGIVLIFIPFLDDLAPELEVLDGILNIVAAAGNVALSIQAIVANPLSAPMEILGLLTAGGFKGQKDFASMAATRRGIASDDLKKIGKLFEDTDAQFQKVIEHACLL